VRIVVKKIELFPSLLSVFNYPDHIAFKDTFNKNLSKYSIEQDGYIRSGEALGFNLVHHEPDFKTFYDWVSICANQYLEELAIDMSKFHLVLAKSWPSIVSDKNQVPAHNHADHHLSFIYYVNAPDGCEDINFSDNRNQNINEPFHGAFGNSWGLRPNIKEYNRYNSGSHYFNVSDGELYIFPSKMNHWTTKANGVSYEGYRQAIAGDFLLIYNDISNHCPFGMYKQEYWKFYS